MSQPEIIAVSVCCGAILIFLLVIILRAIFCRNKRGEKPFVKPDGDSEEIQKHISAAITFRTVSQVNENDVDWSQFDRFAQFLEETYPNIHAKMQKKVIGLIMKRMHRLQ